jgi:hypothetical protein
MFNDIYHDSKMSSALGKLLAKSRTARGLYNQLNDSDWNWRIEEDLSLPVAAATGVEYSGELGLESGWGTGVIKVNPNIPGLITTLDGTIVSVPIERVIGHELAHAVARSNLGRQHLIDPTSNNSVIPIENRIARELDPSAPLRMLNDPKH